ncbi:unnamed protein product [Gadus morhua 'NCC']
MAAIPGGGPYRWLYYWPQQASKKWENLKKRYKDLKSPKTGSGTDEGEVTAASWQFYDDMHEVLGSRPSIDPVVIVASFSEDPTTLRCGSGRGRRQTWRESTAGCKIDGVGGASKQGAQPARCGVSRKRRHEMACHAAKCMNARRAPELGIRCSMCERAFKTNRGLSLHMRAAHMEEYVAQAEVRRERQRDQGKSGKWNQGSVRRPGALMSRGGTLRTKRYTGRRGSSGRRLNFQDIQGRFSRE